MDKNRVMAALLAVGLLAGAAFVGVLALLISSLSLADNPCGLGDDPCTSTPASYVLGIGAALSGAGAVALAIAAAFCAFAYAADPHGPWGSRLRRFALLALVATLIGVIWVLSVFAFTDWFGIQLTGDTPSR